VVLYGVVWCVGKRARRVACVGCVSVRRARR
jgi:hypothetical protein